MKTSSWSKSGVFTIGPFCETFFRNDLPKKSYDFLQEEIGKIQQAVAGSNKLLEKLEKLGDHCPTCEQDIDSEFKTSLLEQEKAKKIENNKKGKEILEEILLIKENNKEYENARKVEKEWENLYRNIDNSLPTDILDQQDLEVQSSLISERLSSARKELTRISSENEKITKYFIT